MKYENKLLENIYQEQLRKALIEWQLNMDGMNSSKEKVLNQIPPIDFISNDCDSQNNFVSEINNAIGTYYNSWDTLRLFLDSYYRQDFLDYIDNKLKHIVKVYSRIINDANKKYQKCMILEKFLTIDNNGFCKYDIVEKIYNDTIYDCICDIWQKYYLTNTNWTFQKFVDACYKGNVHMKDSMYCHIGYKETNSDHFENKK